MLTSTVGRRLEQDSDQQGDGEIASDDDSARYGTSRDDEGPFKKKV